MIVYSLKPADGGFGMFDRIEDGTRFPDAEQDRPVLASILEYVEYVLDVNDTVEPIGPDDADWDRVACADGRIYRQNNGAIIGWRDKLTGEITLELICED